MEYWEWVQRKKPGVGQASKIRGTDCGKVERSGLYGYGGELSKHVGGRNSSIHLFTTIFTPLLPMGGTVRIVTSTRSEVPDYLNELCLGNFCSHDFSPNNMFRQFSRIPI